MCSWESHTRSCRSCCRTAFSWQGFQGRHERFSKGIFSRVHPGLETVLNPQLFLCFVSKQNMPRKKQKLARTHKNPTQFQILFWLQCLLTRILSIHFTMFWHLNGQTSAKPASQCCFSLLWPNVTHICCFPRKPWKWKGRAKASLALCVGAVLFFWLLKCSSGCLSWTAEAHYFLIRFNHQSVVDLIQLFRISVIPCADEYKFELRGNVNTGFSNDALCFSSFLLRGHHRRSSKEKDVRQFKDPVPENVDDKSVGFLRILKRRKIVSAQQPEKRKSASPLPAHHCCS